MLKNGRRILLLIFIFIVFIFVVSFNYWSESFDRKIECIYYTLGENEFENMEVHIVGSFKRSLLREDYYSYKIEIDGVRYPRMNQLLMPFDKKTSAPFRIREIDFKPVNEIQSSYSTFNRNNALYIDYRYWEDTVDLSKQKFLDYGILFFADNSFDEIIIGINRIDNNESSQWTNKVGYDVIVSGRNIEEAINTFDKLNMKIIGEDDEVID